MFNPNEDLPGQDIARRLLDSLEANQPPDWNPFNDAYLNCLLKLAVELCKANPDCNRHFDAEDLLHGFLAKKVYLPKAMRTMFEVPARGESRLGLRLMLSLENFCKDELRRLRSRRCINRGDPTSALVMAESPEPAKGWDYEDVVDRLSRQLDAIRTSLFLRQGAPYLAALLLRLRLDWAGVFDGHLLEQSESMGSVELSLPTLERLTAWSNEEMGTRLGESSLNLGSAWDAIRTLLLANANRKLFASEVAQILHVPRDRLNQWIKRGKDRLKEKMGDEYAEVFYFWPVKESEESE